MTEKERRSMINDLYKSYNGIDYKENKDKTSEFDTGTKTLYMLNLSKPDDGIAACTYILQEIHGLEEVITPINQEKIRLLKIIIKCIQSQYNLSDLEIFSLENKLFS